MKKILFIDQDGTIIEEPPGDFQVDRMDKLRFKPGVIGSLRKITEETDYRLVMVSNQDGLGTAAFPLADFMPPHDWMLKVLAGEGIIFDEILIDGSLPGENSPFRKPGIGMVEKYMNECLDRENSYVIGDRMTDMELASNMGIKGILLGEGNAGGGSETITCSSWERVYHYLKSNTRRVSLSRETSETKVGMTLVLNGNGESDVRTGIGFFDHMLEQVVRHGGIDLVVDADGDRQVDEHHTIEDTAILLGRCFKEALGSKKGIERYGFVLPMEESRAEVLLDFGGRGYLVWKARFEREFVGDFPTEMTRHFFESFCREAGCNLHVKVEGENTHHQIEAIFKAFGRCIKVAVNSSGSGIPSSKGQL